MSPENEEIPDLDDKLVRQTKGNSRFLLLYMWKRGNITLEELQKALHSEHRKANPKAKMPTRKAVQRAVDYLRQKLTTANLTRTGIEQNGGMYYLRHPQK